MVWLVGQYFSDCIENYNTHIIIENLFEFESSFNKDPVEEKSILSYYLEVLVPMLYKYINNFATSRGYFLSIQTPLIITQCMYSLAIFLSKRHRL